MASVAEQFNTFKKAQKLIEEFEGFKAEKLRGPQGLVGPTGPKGDTGPSGPSGASIQGLVGPSGPQGQRGSQGLSGAPGVSGTKGDPGMRGDVGMTGLSPAHEWEGESLRFKQPDGNWGKWVDLKGQAGTSGGGSHGGNVSAVKVTSIATSLFTLTDNQLIWGINIFTFSFPGDVTVVLPKSVEKEKLIELRHEDDTKNITTFIAQ